MGSWASNPPQRSGAGLRGAAARARAIRGHRRAHRSRRETGDAALESTPQAEGDRCAVPHSRRARPTGSETGAGEAERNRATVIQVALGTRPTWVRLIGATRMRGRDVSRLRMAIGPNPLRLLASLLARPGSSI